LLIGAPVASSWPSSHPMVLVAGSIVAARTLGLPRAPRVLLCGLAVAVGVSRSALGVHYPSDVIGGLLLGGAVTAAIAPRRP
jgi:undecaprenyl-diphosphatase